MVAGALEEIGEDQGEGASVMRRLRAIADRQDGRSFLWWPVALTFGIWTYFGLTNEPSRAGVAIIGFMAGALLWLGRKFPVLTIVAMLALGFSLAKCHSDLASTPLLRATTAEVVVTGTVLDVKSSKSKRLTVILAPEAIEGLTAERTPRRLRLSTWAKNGRPPVGTRVSLKARLSPLPTPVAPGGFDYGRLLWFEGIGGTGRITAPVTVVDNQIAWHHRLNAGLAAVRHTMGQRIHAVLDEPYASFAEALIDGERSTIPKALNQSLLVSGLFHILSISGLHMWLVVGGVFWTARAILALSPALASHYPVKKWAAVLAVLMGLFYMLLADSGVATERSFIMIAVVFFAVLADRPALSTRNLAIAALIILVLEPEAAVSASFQMSFLAVLGLVAFYEAWSKLNARRERRALPQNLFQRVLRKLLLGAVVSVATTLVAGTMSSIPAAYHFGRLAPYSLIANGLALPVIGMVVMPSALLAAMLMPLGLEALPLLVMGQGLRVVLLISDWVAGFPGAHVVASQPTALAISMLAGGATLLCLLAGPVRWIGLAVAAIGGMLTLATPSGPDILIERIASNVAIRNASGQFVPAQPRRARFAVEKWLQVNGEEATLGEAAKRSGWTCEEERCVATVKAKQVGYLTGGEGKAIDCAGLDILITNFPLRGACKNVPLRIDRFDLWRDGAHAVRIANNGFIVETARKSQGKRPWVVAPEARKTPYKPK